MSWKFVYNSGNILGRTMPAIAKMAHEAGYDFFTFNGDVYFYAEEKVYKTKIKVSELI